MKLRKKLARTLGLFIISALILSLIPFSALADDPVVLQGDGTEDSPYLISSKEELALLGDFTEKKYFRLTEDIEFEDGELWEPIDNFYGVLDGNGKTITGLTISEQNDTPAGLFRDIEVDAEVKNLNIVDANSVGVNYVGAIAGELYGKVTNCFVSGTVYASDNSAGLLVGYCDHGTINNCSVSGSLFVHVNGGGITGFAYCSEITDCESYVVINGSQNLGCLAGYVLYSDNIANCSVTGEITTPVVEYRTFSVGGFTGLLGYSKIKNSVADVDIVVESENTDITMENIGGFVGYAYASDIEDCDSICNVISKCKTKLIGGFCGKGSKSTIKNCTAEGIIVLRDLIDAVGGFVGANNNTEELLTVENCSFKGSISVHYPDNKNAVSQAVGGFIGGVYEGGVALNNCYAEGEITVYGENRDAPLSIRGVGGFAGFMWQDSQFDIDSCFFEGSIELEPSSLGVGGFIGHIIDSEGAIDNCYSICDIESKGTAAGTAGFAGYIMGNIEEVYFFHCYCIGKITGKNEVAGGFIGGVGHGVIFYNCHSKTDIESGYIAGGFAAESTGAGFRRCSAGGNINLDSGRSDDNFLFDNCVGAGGFIGSMEAAGFIEDCFTTSDLDISFTHEKFTPGVIVAPHPVRKYIGGFCGINVDSVIENSYSANRIKAEISEAVAVEAVMPFASCADEYVAASCYYDKQVVGNDVDKGTEIPGITGRATAEMKKASTFTGWNFENTWRIDGSYPEFVKPAITGMVYSVSENPIPGAELVFSNDDRFTAGSNGKYTALLNYGIYRLRVPLKKEHRETLLAVASRVLDIHTECMLLGGKVTGIKRGDKVKVTLKRNKNTIETKTYTAEGGTIDFCFVDVDSGEYTVTAACTGYISDSRTVVITKADSMDNNLRLTPINKSPQGGGGGYGGSGGGAAAGDTGAYTDTSAGVAYSQKVFTDVNESYGWASEDIYELAQRGVVNGTSETLFSPGKPVMRADIIVMLVRAFGLAGQENENFDDVSPDKYYHYQVGIAKSLGIAKGSGNKFYPESYITRQDMMALIVRALGVIGKTVENSAGFGVLDKFTDKDIISDYAKDAVAALVRNGIVYGSNSMIKPGENLTRAEAAVIINRILKFIEQQ